MVSPGLLQSVPKDTPTGSPGTNPSEPSASKILVPFHHTLCQCQSLDGWVKKCGQGGRQETTPAPDSALNQQCGRVVSPESPTSTLSDLVASRYIFISIPCCPNPFAL